jgi:hypothetical protein
LGNDGNVYDKNGKILGKVQLAAPTPMAAPPSSKLSVPGAAPTPAAAGHARSGSIWTNSLRAFPPGDIRPVEPPSGVKLPPGLNALPWSHFLSM